MDFLSDWFAFLLRAQFLNYPSKHPDALLQPQLTSDILIIFLFTSSRGVIPLTHFPTAPLQTFMSSCTCELCTLPVDARSRVALLTNQRASRGAPRRTFPNHSGELRRSGARARLSVNRRLRGARGRALEKNLKPRELLLLLLRLVAAAKIIETVTSI